jgi:invasion protein IalB
MRQLLSLLVLSLPLWIAQPALSQPTTTEEDRVESPSMTRSTYKDWQSLCVIKEETTTCEISQTLQVEKDGQSSIALRITLSKRADKTLMEIALPLGLDLPAGVVLQVDDSNEISVPFTTCVAQGCAALVTAEEEFLIELRKGNTLKVAFRPFAQTQGVILNASLRGFSSALKELSD